jgi:hypothetical protein
MKILVRWITAIHLFIGTGAVIGGAAAVINPVSPLGMSVEMLKKGPFTSFLVPGLILLLLPGFGNFIAAFFMFRKAPCRGIISGMLGLIMVFWIVIQCVILESVGFLHVLFFLLGSAQGFLAFALLWNEDVFPVSLIKKAVKSYTL